MPNPWDRGTARLLAVLGFEALATTSSGHAASLGRLDRSVTRAEALAHAAGIVGAVGIPVSADLENGFADDPSAVFETVCRAAELGLAGCSIEDSKSGAAPGIYETELAVDRIAAAAEAARRGSGIVLTARAENLVHGSGDLAKTIARLQAYQSAGADVLFAPGLQSLEDVRSVVSSVDLPLSVLVRRELSSVAELAEIGVARVSVGGAFFNVAIAAITEAAVELRDSGTFGYASLAARGREHAKRAFERG